MIYTYHYPATKALIQCNVFWQTIVWVRFQRETGNDRNFFVQKRLGCRCALFKMMITGLSLDPLRGCWGVELERLFLGRHRVRTNIQTL